MVLFAGYDYSTLVIMKWLFFAFILLFALVVFLLSGVSRDKKVKQLQRYKQIILGMSERQMLNIMGEGYNKSMLKDGVTQYIWHVEGQNNSGQRVTITCRNGSVEEVIPENVQI